MQFRGWTISKEFLSRLSPRILPLRSTLDEESNYRNYSIILGSGFSNFSYPQGYSEVGRFSYSDLIGMKSQVKGHGGFCSVLRNDSLGVHLICWSGRVHFYEVVCSRRSVFQVIISYLLGVRRILSTCSAGYLVSEGEAVPGRLIRILDQVSFFPTNPLIGPNDPDLGTRFPTSISLYNREDSALCSLNLPGAVYSAGLCGPNYETPLESRFLHKGGVRLVGMSVCNEAIMANYFEIPFWGIAFVSNVINIENPCDVCHEEVLASFKENLGSLQRDWNRVIDALVTC